MENFNGGNFASGIVGNAFNTAMNAYVSKVLDDEKMYQQYGYNRKLMRYQADIQQQNIKENTLNAPVWNVLGAKNAGLNPAMLQEGVGSIASANPVTSSVKPKPLAAFSKGMGMKKADKLDYGKGDRVKHIKYGAGTVKDICDVKEEQMPKLFESYETVGEIKTDVATKLGLPEGVKVCVGAGDNAAAAVGTGVVGAGLISGFSVD